MTYLWIFIPIKVWKEDFEWVSTDVDHMQILKDCSISWLSLLIVLGRVLTQYPALVAYCTCHDDVEKARRVKRAMEQFNDPRTKLTLLFLNIILPAKNDLEK